MNTTLTVERLKELRAFTMLLAHRSANNMRPDVGEDAAIEDIRALIDAHLSPSAELGRMEQAITRSGGAERIYTKLDVEALVAAALAAKEQRERLREFDEQTDVLLRRSTCKPTFTCKECSQDLFKCQCREKAQRQAPPPPPANVQAVVEGLQRVIDDFTPDEVVGRSHIQQAIALLRRPPNLYSKECACQWDSTGDHVIAVCDAHKDFLQPFSEELRQAMLEGAAALQNRANEAESETPSSFPQAYNSAERRVIRLRKHAALLTRAAEGKETPHE